MFAATRGRRDQGRGGFSLIELLVVVAIISILMGMYLATFSKVLGKARQLAGKEAFRQQQIGRLADHANIANHHTPPADRDECREAFRREVETHEGNIVVTELRYRVTNDDEFRAYYHTLIDPANTDPLEYQGDILLAKDEDGNTFELPSIGSDGWAALDNGATIPVMWDFISQNMGETTLEGLGANVLYSDGHVELVKYPGAFPATKVVAELGHKFMLEQ